MFRVIFDGNTDYTGVVKFSILDKEAPVSLVVEGGVVVNEKDAESVYKKIDNTRNYAKVLLKEETKKENKKEAKEGNTMESAKNPLVKSNKKDR